MANAQHLEIVRQGVEAIHAWRMNNPDIQNVRLDLREADLHGLTLSGAPFVMADLRGANLSDAELIMALFDQADLRGGNLARAKLHGASFGGANLREADLNKAQLGSARLMGADLSKARLCGVHLSFAMLWAADLREADLRDALLDGVNLASAVLSGADLSGAICRSTLFADVDLSRVKGLASIRHLGPSTVGVDTLSKSKGKIPDVFLRGCGVPETLIQKLDTPARRALEPYKCVIASSEADSLFTERLHNDLQAAGVRCWPWSEEMSQEQAPKPQSKKRMPRYDKLVAILSEDSLKSEPLIREIERALQKELQQKTETLLLIALDQSLFSWEHELRESLERKSIADFHKWREPESYKKGLQRLVRALGTDR